MLYHCFVAEDRRGAAVSFIFGADDEFGDIVIIGILFGKSVNALGSAGDYECCVFGDMGGEVKICDAPRACDHEFHGFSP